MTTPAQPLPGEQPGSEQWIVVLRQRGYDPQAELRAVREQPGPALRSARLAQFLATAEADQDDVRQFVRGIGGRFRRTLWTANACCVEIPQEQLRALRDHPRVLKLWPNEARPLASRPAEAIGRAALPPIGGSTNVYNHNVGAAHQIAWQTGDSAPKGEGVTIGIFDTGLDIEWTSVGGVDPHPVFYRDAGQTITQGTRLRYLNDEPTRLWDSVMVGSIDCNTPGVHPFGSPCTSTKPRHAMHGTGVAAIAAGAHTNASSQGHAPRSLVMGWSIVDSTSHGWVATASHYLEAIGQLRTWLVAQPGREVQVLNISVGGWPDPDHPVSLALDELAADPATDVLVVTAAGNEGDATTQSHGAHNLIAVGAVHKRATADAVYWPMSRSSRGPLYGSPQRNYPDVCATGAGELNFAAGTDPCASPFQVVMPAIDNDLSGLVYNAMGTSMAAPQVAGAAALYRARRGRQSPPVADSALEAKAAILLNVDDAVRRMHASGSGVDTYTSRNSYGEGYVRDDYLVQFAERLTAIQPLAQSGIVEDPGSCTDLTWQIRGGTWYACVIAWFRPRQDDSQGELQPFGLANLDLEILDGAALLGLSQSRGNSYERVTFRTPGTESETRTVTVRVHCRQDGGAGRIEFFAAGRELADQSSPPIRRAGRWSRVEQVAGCVGSGVARTVTRAVPTAYEQAYGSFTFVEHVNAHHADRPRRGYPLGAASMGGTQKLHLRYAAPVVGGDFDAVGLAFRAWRPFAGFSGSVTVDSMWLYECDASVPIDPDLQLPPSHWRTNSVQVVASPVHMQVGSPSWIADEWGKWAYFVPFTDLAPASSYSYRGTAAGRDLRILVEFGLAGMPPGGILEVDWAEDGGGGYDSMASSDTRPGGPFLRPGNAPVIGLVEVQAGGLPPDLTMLGEPWRSEDAVFLLQQAAPNALVSLSLGSPLPYVVPGWSGCDIMVSSDDLWDRAWTTDELGVAKLGIPGGSLTSVDLLGVAVSWQALVIPAGQAWSLSNVVVTYFGGV